MVIKGLRVNIRGAELRRLLSYTISELDSLSEKLTDSLKSHQEKHNEKNCAFELTTSRVIHALMHKTKVLRVLRDNLNTADKYRLSPERLNDLLSVPFIITDQPESSYDLN